MHHFILRMVIGMTERPMREGKGHARSGAVTQADSIAKLGELGPMQALGEKVSHVEIGSDISDAQCFTLDPLANSKVASVDVLNARAGGVRSVDRLV